MRQGGVLVRGVWAAAWVELAMPRLGVERSGRGADAQRDALARSVRGRSAPGVRASSTSQEKRDKHFYTKVSREPHDAQGGGLTSANQLKKS